MCSGSSSAAVITACCFLPMLFCLRVQRRNVTKEAKAVRQTIRGLSKGFDIRQSPTTRYVAKEAVAIRPYESSRSSAERRSCRRKRKLSDTDPMNGRRDLQISGRTQAREAVRRKPWLSARFGVNTKALALWREPEGSKSCPLFLTTVRTKEPIGIRTNVVLPKQSEGSGNYPPVLQTIPL